MNNRTPLVQNFQQLLQLLEDGYVIHAPDHTDGRVVCELTLPQNLDVFFETSAVFWYGLEEVMRRLETKEAYTTKQSLQLRKVQIKEPDCGVEWVIVNAANSSALRWQTTPEILYEEAMRNVTLNKDVTVEDFEVDDELEAAPDKSKEIAVYKVIANFYVDGVEF